MITADISKKIRTFSGYRLLEVNASFPPNSVTTICGPSGAGKTTFLKIIAGLMVPERGIITVSGTTWLDTSKAINISPQKRRAGFVFQDYALFPNMSVHEHLKYATKNMRLIERLLTIGEMERFAGHKPEHLSGGQQQRLAILRALATEPDVLLMDEPFSALDQELRLLLIADLKILLEQTKITCLIVTHNPAEIEGLAKNTLKIGGGEDSS